MQLLKEIFLTNILFIKKNPIMIRKFCSNISQQLQIPMNKIIISFSRSSGAGGQNVNKVNTKVELRFNVDLADWLNDKAKIRLKELYPNKINKEGDFILTSQEHRTQEQNRREAEKKLQYIIYEANKEVKERVIEPYKESEIEEERRIKAKKIRSEIKNMRRNNFE
jgi:peptidyl-tRNA hydrolase ICT1